MAHKLPDLLNTTFAELQDGLSKHCFSSVDLVKAYQARIAEVNDRLRAVIAINPKALEEAARLDEERRQGKIRGTLHGIPIGVKDNIDVEGMETTAGSYALKGAVNAGDAESVRHLREAGGIVIAKLNCAVWSNWRNLESDAWSPVGGQCTSPFYPQGSPRGSSSGSGVAAILGLAAGCLGSDTSGSIIAPASNCAIVGIRPAPGVVSGKGVVPISSLHDTVGPMCRTVQDAAYLLDAITSREAKYTDFLKEGALAGMKIGVPRNLWDWNKGPWSMPIEPGMQPAFEAGLATMRKLGAIVEDIEVEPQHIPTLEENRGRFLFCPNAEFKVEIAEYLATLKDVPTGVKDLADIIEFTQSHESESPATYESQANFLKAQDSVGMADPRYIEARRLLDSSKGIIDYEMRKHRSDAWVFPGGCTRPWTQSGYPMVSVPLSYLPKDTVPSNAKSPAFDKFAVRIYASYPSQPFGLSFAAGPGSEGELIGLACAFQQATLSNPKPVPYAEAIPKTQLADIVAGREATTRAEEQFNVSSL